MSTERYSIFPLKIQMPPGSIEGVITTAAEMTDPEPEYEYDKLGSWLLFRSRAQLNSFLVFLRDYGKDPDSIAIDPEGAAHASTMYSYVSMFVRRALSVRGSED